MAHILVVLGVEFFQWRVTALNTLGNLLEHDHFLNLGTVIIYTAHKMRMLTYPISGIHFVLL